jgi:hypothetical protein
MGRHGSRRSRHGSIARIVDEGMLDRVLPPCQPNWPTTEVAPATRRIDARVNDRHLVSY